MSVYSVSQSEEERAVERTWASIVGLDMVHRRVLQLVSLVYDPVSPGDLYHAVCRADDLIGAGRRPTRTDVESIVRRLTDEGLVVRTAGSGIACHRTVVETASRSAVVEGTAKGLADLIHGQYWDYYGLRSYQEAFKWFRLMLYAGNFAAASRILHVHRELLPGLPAVFDPYWDLCTRPFDGRWMLCLEDRFLGTLVSHLYDRALFRLEPTGALDGFIAGLPKNRLKDDRAGLQALQLDRAVLCGKIADAIRAPSGPDDVSSHARQGWALLLAGRLDESVAAYRQAEKAERKVSRRPVVTLPGISGIFHPLALVLTGDRKLGERAYKVCAEGTKRNLWHADLFGDIAGWIRLELDAHGQPSEFVKARPVADGVTIRDLVALWIARWTGTKKSQPLIERAQAVAQKAMAGGYDWVRAECAEVLADHPSSSPMEPVAFGKANMTVPLVTSRSARTAWERTLDAMAGVAGVASDRTPDGPSSRLVWVITSDWGDDDVTIEPRVQKRSRTGAWSKGTRVALSKLFGGGAQLSFLTEQDRRACASIQDLGGRSRGWGQVGYQIDSIAGLGHLVGHPHVYIDMGSLRRMDIVERRPELRVLRTTRGLAISFGSGVDPDDEGPVSWEADTRLGVTVMTEPQRRLAQIVGKGLLVPADGQEKVARTVTALSALVTVQSELTSAVPEADEVDADARIHVLLAPAGEGFEARLAVRPLGDAGPRMEPGRGGTLVVAQIEGRRVQARRDPAAEMSRVEALLDACPVLDGEYPTIDGMILPGPDECLELLLQLRSLGDAVVLEWPQGEKLRLRGSASSFSASVGLHKDWFLVEGEVRVDDSLVLDMLELLRAMEGARGRFVPIQEGEYVALEEGLVRRLDRLRSLTEARRSELRLHPVAAASLGDLFDDGVRTDGHFDDLVDKLRQARELTPDVPPTLGAELRDYQREGFTWLARLAHWGAGACLADDMGLGKTVQALALLLHRAHLGPALVVAPTSVCHGWFVEADRFAPTLRMQDLRNADRETVVQGLAPGDVLVVSYGLLNTQKDRLAKVRFATIVLDEAQAIKNVASKRSHAAMALDGGFRMICTGTPLENHLGELYNLMSFINPGLLGSAESFARRFASPIERDHDPGARSRLRRLVRPFILRRTKSQVLEELPGRTEIIVSLELSDEERAFYEALRTRALESLGRSQNGPAASRPAGTQPGHIRILAEIMKLRRACCSPRLVAPGAPLASTKLEELDRLLDELFAGGHRALVFSQFVDHLSIVRSHLEARSVPYRYLDGSTPPAARATAVDEFQAGGYPVFLISLKAGGLGLNLTAADYVIHMDPWWNPAVEDQASDRAHRIGQTRPVTIYKLICRDTIEERIVELHRHKRGLAEDLLSGADVATHLTAEELIALISGSS